MKAFRIFFKSVLFLGICLVFKECQTNEVKKPLFVTGQGTGINSVTLMVDDIDAAVSYYKDTLGFTIRGKAKKGFFDGTRTAAINLGDMSAFELLSEVDSVQQDSGTAFISSFLSSHQGVRLFSLSSSSVDSTQIELMTNGFQTDSIQEYQTRLTQPKGWSRDNPERKSLDFNNANPPNYLPRFIEKFGYDYKKTNKDWKTYYVFTRMYSTQPNGVVGINAIRVIVDDLDSRIEEFKNIGFELVEQTEDMARFSVFRHQEIHLLSAKSQEQKDFLKNRGDGVFAMRFDITNIDSTFQYFEKELPTKAMNRTPEKLTIASEYALGVQLEFVEEPEEQNIMARTYTPAKELDSLAVKHAAALYSKYCALCHADDRQGYAADNAPSLRSKSLLGSSMGNNFMRYTIQYGRANTAMAGYFNAQGGPLEYIEIELLMQWLNEMADVKEPIEISRDPIVGDIVNGASLYDAQCAVCHGKNGEGVTAPALGNPITLATATDHFLRYAIAEGRDGTPMVAFKDQLTDKEIDDVVAFLRSRAAGWDIPEPEDIKIPEPEDYVLNPEGEDPVFDLRENKYVSSEQVNQALKEGKRMIILDARSEVAWRQMHIPGAIPVPYYEEPENFVNDIPNDDTQIVIYCACPHAASGRVQSTLIRNGYKNTAIIDEGILVWAQLGFPVRSGS